MSAPDDEVQVGVALCGLREAMCACALPAGHEGAHECDPVVCGGTWTYDDLGFRPLRLPGSALMGPAS